MVTIDYRAVARMITAKLADLQTSGFSITFIAMGEEPPISGTVAWCQLIKIDFQETGGMRAIDPVECRFSASILIGTPDSVTRADAYALYEAASYVRSQFLRKDTYEASNRHLITIDRTDFEDEGAPDPNNRIRLGMMTVTGFATRDVGTSLES